MSILSAKRLRPLSAVIVLASSLSAAATAQPTCSTGSFELTLNPTTTGRSATFVARDELGYCSGLAFDSFNAGLSSIDVMLRAAAAGPAACGGGTLEGELPLAAPGTYTVRAFLDVEGQQRCQLGVDQTLQVTGTASSMLNDGEFELGLSAWSATPHWTWLNGIIRSVGFAQIGQCVPVAGSSEYRLRVAARGDGGSAGIGVGVFYHHGPCGTPDIGTDGVIESVGSDTFEDVELVFHTPFDSSGSQLYAQVAIYNENTGAPLLVDSAILERPGCGVGSDEVACLHGGRFEARLSWEAFDETTGPGRLVSSVSDSSLWWFFNPTNWEMMVKVLRACDPFGHWWVFAAGATNVAWTLDVDDTSTGNSRTYQNPLGERSPAVTGTDAFDCAAGE